MPEFEKLKSKYLGQMKLEKRSDGWWILNLPDTIVETGPYDTKVEAAQILNGLADSYASVDSD